MRKLIFALVIVMIFAGCAKQAQPPPVDGFGIAGWRKPSYTATLNHIHPMARGLQLMWLINESPAASLFDLTRNGYTGTITGPTWTHGDRGPVLSFDGTDDYLQATRISGMSDWSAYIRYCPIDVSNAYALLDQGDILITQNSDDIVWGFTDSGNVDNTSTASTVLSSGTWVSLLATKSGSSHVLYVNGISTDTLSDASTPLTSETYLSAGKRTGTGIAYVALTPSNLTSEQAVSGLLEYSRGSADMSGTLYENAPAPRQGTIEFWTKPYFASTDTNTRYLLDASCVVLYWNGSATQWKATVNGVSITASDTFSANTWIHVVLRWETEGTDSLDLAIDGTDASTVTTSQTVGTPSSTLYVHKDNAGSNTYSGASAFRWLNRKIADADIDTLYASGNGNLDSFDVTQDVAACSNFTDSATSIRAQHRGKTVSAITDGATEDTLTVASGADNSFADNDEVAVYDASANIVFASVDGDPSSTSMAIDDGAGGDPNADETVSNTAFVTKNLFSDPGFESNSTSYITDGSVDADFTLSIDSTLASFDRYSQKIVIAGADDSDEVQLRNPNLSNGGDYATRFFSQIADFDFYPDLPVRCYMDIDGSANVVTQELFASMQLRDKHREFQGYGYSVWGDGTYIYLANYGGLHAYSFNGSAFTHLDHIDDGGNGWGVWGDGTYIYLANHSDGLRAYTFNGTTFTNVGHIDDGGFGWGVWGDGTYIYLADNYDGIYASTPYFENGWQESTICFTADQDGAHNYNVRVTGAGAGENDATIYLDQFELRQNAVAGGDCEAADGNGLPSGWSDTGSPDADETQTDTADYHSDTSSIYLASAEENEGVTQNITVEDASYYTITFFSKNDNQDVDVTLGTAATATIDATTSTNTWTKFSYTFLTTDTTLVLSAVSGAASQSGWFDDFSLVKLDTADATSAARTLDYLDGKIDDIRIWDRALTPEEAHWLQREPYAPIK